MRNVSLMSESFFEAFLRIFLKASYLEDYLIANGVQMDPATLISCDINRYEIRDMLLSGELVMPPLLLSE